MISPSYTAPPVLFQLPPYADAAQVNQYANLVPAGPFEWNGNLFWVVSEQDALGNGSYSIVAYKSTDLGRTQPFSRIPSGMKETLILHTCFYPGAGSIVYFAFVDGTASKFFGNILFGSLDMAAESFSVLDTGVSITNATNGIGQLFGFLLPNGHLIALWAYNNFSGKTHAGELVANVYDGVAWGGPVVLATAGIVCAGSSDVPLLLGANVLPSNQLGIWWSTGSACFNGTSTLRYGVFDGAVTFTPKVAMLLAGRQIDVFYPYVPIYDSTHDIAAISVGLGIPGGTARHEYLEIFSVSPSDGSGAAITQTQVDADPLDANNWELSMLAGNAANTQFYYMVNAQFGGVGTGPKRLYLYTAPSLLGPWSAQGVFYDENSHPPSPTPADLTDPLIFPYFARVLSAGQLAVTAAFEYKSVPGNASVFALGALIAALPPVANTGQLAFVGARRLKAPQPVTCPPYPNNPKSFTWILPVSITGLVGGGPITARQPIIDYDFELYQFMLLVQQGVGPVAPLLAPVATLRVYDQNKVAISNLPVLDLFLDGGANGVYKNGALQPPLLYCKNSVVQVDVFSQITDATKLPTTLLIHLVGRKLIPC